MKILIKILTIFTVLCVLACSQTFENVSNNNQSFDKNTKVKGLLIMNINNSSRTITNELTNADIHSAVLTANDKVVGNWNGENVIEQINNDKSIMLDVGKHNLVLCIKNKDGNILATAQTEEYIKAGSNKIYFYLESVISGNGSFEVTFSWQADGVDSIKAGLYDSETDKEVAGYEMTTLAINEKTVVYATDEIPAGQYILKIDFYDNNGESLKIYTEILQVEAYRKTTATRTFTGFNTNHTIEYILTESWKEGFTPITIRNAAQEVKLPTIENINTEKDINSHILKWYTTETFDKGTEIIKINTGTEKDMKLYGKIEECIKATVDNFSEIIQNLPDGGPYNVVVTGELTNEKLSAMATCIEENSTKMINLDLGNTTGLTEIKDYTFQYCNNLTSIIIPEKVTEICYFAFFGCSSLASVTIPDSVTTIGGSAFYGCSSLTSVIIPDNVTSIGEGAFWDCSSLESVTIPNGVTSIGRTTFCDCSSLESVTIGNSVTTIGGSAFDGCSSLTSVIIPDSVTTIDDWAFRDCSSLTSAIIGNSVTSIGEEAFGGCSSLTSVTIPDSVTEIGWKAFTSCGITRVDISDLTTWYNIKFGHEANPLYSYDANPLHCGAKLYLNGNLVTDLIIPDNVTSIGDNAFYGCSSLESVTIPDSVTSIGDYAFKGCSSLESVIIPDSVTSIGKWGFSSDNLEITVDTDDKYLYSEDGTTIILCDSSVTNVVIPENITIQDDAFYYCRNIETIVTGDTITSLNYFPLGSTLKSITIGNGITSINDYTFNYCSSLTSVTIPDSVTSIGGAAFIGCSSLESIIIPDSVTSSIDSFTFDGCSSLKSVTIGNGVTSIGHSAFRGCISLESVTIGDSVTSIDSYAFEKCSSLESVVIPDSVTTIGGSAFYGCSSLTSVIIPDNVTSIGDVAFWECSSLTSVTIPDSVTSIGQGAFSDCSSLIYNEYDNGLYLGNADNPYLVLVKGKDTLITSCEINNKTKIILERAFWKCGFLTSVTIPDSVTSICCFDGDWFATPFYKCSSLIYNEYDNGLYLGNADNPYLVLVEAKDISITSCEINNKTKIILEEAFDGCSSLESVTIPDSVTTIGDDAFRGCSSLESVVIPDSVTSIGAAAFRGCSSLTSVTIGDGVTTIGAAEFEGCSSLESVTIGDGVTSIGDNAFRGCSSLTSVTIPDSVTYIGESAFYYGNLTTVNYKGTKEQWEQIRIDSYGNEDLTSATINYNYSGE